MTEVKLPIIYYANKVRLLKLLLGSLLCVAGCIWIISTNNFHNLRYSTEMSKAIIYMGLAFFGLGSLAIAYLLITGMKLFEISEKGITAKKTKLIPWSEIAEIRVVEQNIPSRGKKGRSIKWIGIFLRDKDSYYSGLSKVAKMRAQLREKLVGTPVVLDSTNAKLNPDTLVMQLNTYLEK